jgi:hypothetical protein
MYQQRGWSWVLAPRPFDVVSSSLYIGVLVTDLYFPCNCDITWWHVMLIVGAILALLSIERLEYWFYGEEIPTKTALFATVPKDLLAKHVSLTSSLFSFAQEDR